MGQVSNLCGEDIFKKLMEQYGDDFMKFILAEKSKDVIKDKFRDLNIQSDNKFGEFTAKVNSIVDQKLQSLDKSFESAKSSVDSFIPGGISTLQRLKGESINQFSGYNKLQSKVDGIRDQALNTAQVQKTQVMNDLNGKKNEMISTIQAQRPKIPIYEQLPQPVRTQILQKGEKQFSEQIQKNKQGIIQRLMNQFLPSSFQMISQFLTQINPENPLASIVQNAFGEMTGNIKSANGGGAGGVFNNIQQIFR